MNLFWILVFWFWVSSWWGFVGVCKYFCLSEAFNQSKLYRNEERDKHWRSCNYKEFESLKSAAKPLVWSQGWMQWKRAWTQAGMLHHFTHRKKSLAFNSLDLLDWYLSPRIGDGSLFLRLYCIYVCNLIATTSCWVAGTIVVFCSFVDRFCWGLKSGALGVWFGIPQRIKM
jgi:hypothetical protein